MNTIRTSDLVQASLLGATSWVRETHANEFQNRIVNDWGGELDLFAKCESPLEGAWLVWWEAYHFNPAMSQHCPYDLRQQYAVECSGRRYRLDFVVVDKLTRAPILAVELDGHEWHQEKTREEAASRNRRDRDLQSLGFPVFHFSYTEFLDDTIGCVAQVYGTAVLQTMGHRRGLDREIA